METHSRVITYCHGDTVKIKAIADVHLGADGCDERAFRDFLARDDDDMTFIIIIGDLLDSIIASDLKRYRKSGDSTIGDAILDEQIDRAHEILWPYRDRILGIGVGNHEDTILGRCATDLTARLCRRLDVPSLGYSGLYQLKLIEPDKRGVAARGRKVTIRYHHGWTSSRTAGGQLTSNVRDLVSWDADVFLYGHGHALHTYQIPRLGISGKSLVSRDLVVCLCGTFLKTYSSRSTYSERKGYPPVRIGAPVVHIRPTWRAVEMRAVA